MANKYVDVDLLKEEFEQTFDMQDLYSPAHFFNVVDSMPTADVQEVVRCKDCIYYSETYKFCDCGEKTRSYLSRFYPNADDFCNYGKRKDGDNNG